MTRGATTAAPKTERPDLLDAGRAWGACLGAHCDGCRICKAAAGYAASWQEYAALRRLLESLRPGGGASL